MIVVTFRGVPSPLIGRVKGVTVVSQARGPSPCAALTDAMQRAPDERDGFLFVSPGAELRSARIWPVLQRPGWAVAAYVDRIGSTPSGPKPFDGIGQVSIETLLVRPGDAARRLLLRWSERNATTPGATGREPINLAIALHETGTPFLCLPRTWVWREALHRPLDPDAEPVVEYGRGSVKRSTEPVKTGSVQNESQWKVEKNTGPEMIHSGHMKDYSGYARCNREILFRTSNTLRVRVDRSDISQEPIHIGQDLNARIDAYIHTLVSARAPLLRFYTPKEEVRNSYRVCFTMLETAESIHSEFASLLNRNYNECFVPTEWNKGTFQTGGVRIPIRVVPLGVNKMLFRPGPKVPRPRALLLTGSGAGCTEPPRGYTFLTLFQPTFRKGVDALVAAFDAAFRNRPDIASLVLVSSVHGGLDQHGCSPFGRFRRGVKGVRSRVYHLTGKWDDWQMAQLYRAFDCYVACSRAEGWDLPMCEAAACGLPVIASDCTSHAEILKGSGAWTFEADTVERVPDAEQVCRFYEGQMFHGFGKRSVEQLSALLRRAADENPLKTFRRKGLPVVDLPYTWDASADLVSRRFIEICEERKA